MGDRLIFHAVGMMENDYGAIARRGFGARRWTLDGGLWQRGGGREVNFAP